MAEGAADERRGVAHPGVLAALTAAFLFGVGTPLSKALLARVDPWLLAGLLYLGSGLGLFLYRAVRRLPGARLAPGEWRWLAGATLAGGIVAPVLLMVGLAGMPAADASLLLNTEVVFTALLAWLVFRENFDARIAAGVLAIVAGAAVLGGLGAAGAPRVAPSLAIVAACFAWGLDNNLTRRVSLADATWVAAWKGLAAGTVNSALAVALGASAPAPLEAAGALCVGLVSYGVSLTLFVVGLRRLGTARTGAYFSVAPFFGALASVAFLGEPLRTPLVLAGGLMALGVWLHLAERHSHEHAHPALEHDHEHTHDDHHQHAHGDPIAPGTRHGHPHRHAPVTHRHGHYPDAHHRHRH